MLPLFPAYYPSPTMSLPTRIPVSIISHFNPRTTASANIVLANSLRSASTSGMWGSLLVNPGEVEADVTLLTIMVRSRQCTAAVADWEVPFPGS